MFATARRSAPVENVGVWLRGTKRERVERGAGSWPAGLQAGPLSFESMSVRAGQG